MAVTGKPLGPQKPKSTGIINATTAEEAARHTVRWTSIGVLGISFLGTMLAINGGAESWPYFWRDLSLIAIIGGIAIQALLTVLQWGYRKQRTDPRWWIPFVFDVACTYMGYGPFMLPIFAGIVRPVSEAAALPVAHIAMLLVAVLTAYYPEQTLINEGE